MSCARGGAYVLMLVALAACGERFQAGETNGTTTATSMGGGGASTVPTGGAGGATMVGGGGGVAAAGGIGGYGGATGGAEAGSGGALPTGGSGGAGASGGEGGTTPVSDISLEFSEINFIVSCFQPPPDQVSGTFTVRYTNNGSAPGTVTIPGTPHLRLEGTADGPKWYFTVAPDTSGPVAPNGGQTDVTHVKVTGSSDADPEGVDPCDYCQALPLLYIVPNVDGAYVVHSQVVDSFQCVN